MSLQTADVTKLKCILFQQSTLLAQTYNYGVDCKKEDIQDVVTDIIKYLTLLGLSGVICRSLECKILEILDKYSVPTACNRNVVIITPGAG